MIASISFQLPSLASKQNDVFSENSFPLVSTNIKKECESSCDFISYNDVIVSPKAGNSTNGMGINRSKSSIYRPRNKFIIARNVLSQLIRSEADSATHDISKVVSVIWKEKNEQFHHYFEYLSTLESTWYSQYQSSSKFLSNKRVNKYNPEETNLNKKVLTFSKKNDSISVNAIPSSKERFSNLFSQACSSSYKNQIANKEKQSSMTLKLSFKPKNSISSSISKKGITGCNSKSTIIKKRKFKASSNSFFSSTSGITTEDIFADSGSVADLVQLSDPQQNFDKFTDEFFAHHGGALDPIFFSSEFSNPSHHYLQSLGNDSLANNIMKWP